MKSTLFSDSFRFLNITRPDNSYTDCRCGSPMNFVAYMKKGNARIVSPDITIEINEDEAFYIPKNLSYQSYWYGKPEVNFLSFAYRELDTSDDNNFELQTLKCDRNLIDKILNLPTPGTQINCKTLSMFYDILADLIPIMKISPDSKEKSIIREVTECIRRNPFSSIAEISRLCKISESYLYALFKKNAHSTPNDYRQRVMCNMGVELLLTTDKKIEEISELTGFSSGSYFRKVLKKHLGYTPREIRRLGPSDFGEI